MAEPHFDLDVTLGLFDGISCGQEALKRAGITTRIYLASEIEKYPKMITRKNHPLTVQLGDVRNVVADDLPHINLLMGGSPCQGFSFAGKQLNFNDPRSALFFEFVRLLKECEPDYFLLENVMMKQEYQDIISTHVGVQPQKKNSADVSAQNRVRLYWWGKRVGDKYVQIPIPEIKDKGIVLKDVLDYSVTEVLSDKGMAYMLRSESTTKNIPRLKARAKYENEKSHTLTTSLGLVPQRVIGIDRPCELKEYNKNSTCHHVATATDIKGNESIKRVYAETGKSPTVTTMGGGHREPKVLTSNKPTYRKLTVLECSRLQTLPDSYLQNCYDDKGKEISNSQKFKALGNGWTVDVIVHLLQGLKQKVAA